MSNTAKLEFCTDPYCWEPDDRWPKRSGNPKGKDVLTQLAENCGAPPVDINKGAVLEIAGVCSARIGSMLCPRYCRNAPIARVTTDGASEFIQVTNAPTLIEEIRRRIQK